MKALIRRLFKLPYAQGGQITVAPAGIPAKLSEGGVWCMDCDAWSFEGGTVRQQMQRFQDHQWKCH